MIVTVNMNIKYIYIYLFKYLNCLALFKIWGQKTYFVKEQRVNILGYGILRQCVNE